MFSAGAIHESRDRPHYRHGGQAESSSSRGRLTQLTCLIRKFVPSICCLGEGGGGKGLTRDNVFFFHRDFLYFQRWPCLSHFFLLKLSWIPNSNPEPLTRQARALPVNRTPITLSFNSFSVPVVSNLFNSVYYGTVFFCDYSITGTCSVVPYGNFWCCCLVTCPTHFFTLLSSLFTMVCKSHLLKFWLFCKNVPVRVLPSLLPYLLIGSFQCDRYPDLNYPFLFGRNRISNRLPLTSCSLFFLLDI